MRTTPCPQIRRADPDRRPRHRAVVPVTAVVEAGRRGRFHQRPVALEVDERPGRGGETMERGVGTEAEGVELLDCEHVVPHAEMLDEAVEGTIRRTAVADVGRVSGIGALGASPGVGTVVTYLRDRRREAAEIELRRVRGNRAEPRCRDELPCIQHEGIGNRVGVGVACGPDNDKHGGERRHIILQNEEPPRRVGRPLIPDAPEIPFAPPGRIDPGRDGARAVHSADVIERGGRAEVDEVCCTVEVLAHGFVLTTSVVRSRAPPSPSSW